MTTGGSVYWYASITSSSYKPVVDVGWMFFSLFVLTTIPAEITLVPGGELRVDEWAILAASAEHLAVPAYDFSSWVVWSRA
jgi:hypothetical protein